LYEEALSLRARLTLYFLIVVLVTAAIAHGWQAVARSTDRQVRSELEMARARRRSP
jgi:hypothetical protein